LSQYGSAKCLGCNAAEAVEQSRKVTLIAKAYGIRHFNQAHIRIAQVIFSHLESNTVNKFAVGSALFGKSSSE